MRKRTALPAANGAKGGPIASKTDDTQMALLAVLALVVATIAVFVRVCRYDFVRVDDDIHVYHNVYLALKPPANFVYFWRHAYEGLYVPLSYNVFALIGAAAAISAIDPKVTDTLSLYDPSYFHTANLALHVVNVLLVFAVVRRLVGTVWPAALGAAAFALHPFQVESVAWVSELRGLLSGSLCLLCILCYLRRFDAAAPTARNGWFATSVLFATLALLAKPVAVALPVALFALDALLLKRPVRQAALAAAPFVALSAAFAVVTSLAQPSHVPNTGSLIMRPFIAGDALAFYIVKFFAPFGLTLDYGRTPSFVQSHWFAYVDWLLPAIVIAAVYLLRKRLPWLVSASLVALAFVLPVLGLVTFAYQLFSTVSDRYMYLSLVGVAIAVAFAVRGGGRAGQAVACVAVFYFAALSFVQLGNWQNSEHLLRHMVAINGSSYLGRNNLGVIETEKGDYNAARRDFDALSSTWPGDIRLTTNVANLDLAQGDYASAVKLATAVYTADPKSERAYRIAGEAYFGLGDYANAKALLEKSEELAPGNHLAMLDIAKCDNKLKLYPAAIEMLQYLIAAAPRLQDSYIEIGDSYLGLGQPANAVKAYSAAQIAGPDTQRIELGLAAAYAATGDAARSQAAGVSASKLAPADGASTTLDPIR